MKIVRVQYTAKPEYAEKNRENILHVMEELRKLNNPGIKYSVYNLADGKSFMHLAHFKTDDEQKILLGLESFKKFGAELKANGIEVPPKSEDISIVGSSFDFFN